MAIDKMLYLFVQGFFLGFGPCLMTCAPIIIPYVGTKKDWREGLAATLSFSLGRLAVYLVLGGLFGYFGAYILKAYYSSGISYYIKAVLASIVIILGVAVISGKDFNFKFCRAVEGNMAVLGLLVGLSPCIPLIGIMIEIALFSDNFLAGLVYSFFFGMGTILSPILLIGAIAPVIGGALTQRFARTFNAVCGALLIIVGLYIFIR